MNIFFAPVSILYIGTRTFKEIKIVRSHSDEHTRILHIALSKVWNLNIVSLIHIFTMNRLYILTDIDLS
jgi:hypothetical protein